MTIGEQLFLEHMRALRDDVAEVKASVAEVATRTTRNERAIERLQRRQRRRGGSRGLVGAATIGALLASVGGDHVKDVYAAIRQWIGRP